jgi:NosR/NirI family transcriptional regulator, nitrous oxide reductase regulator
VEEASVIRQQYKTGSWILGGFLGLVLGLMLMNQFVTRKKTDYTPNKTGCFSCGRCMDYCPVNASPNPSKGGVMKHPSP